MNHLNEIHASLVLNALPQMTPFRYQALLQHFQTAHQAFQAGFGEWRTLEGFDPPVLEKIRRHWAQSCAIADSDLIKIEKEGISVFLWQSDVYPKQLRDIAAPPPVLYLKGKERDITRPAVAVVGSRRCSYYGQRVAKDIAKELSYQGFVTISGLARGIDQHVHEATIKEAGETWAVLGSGLDCLYPPENRRLSKDIESSGTLISEFPLSTMPFPGNFPRRNRIISGLSLATVVVEGTQKSGSLITAKLAVEQGRDVFAVPGPITSPLSEAAHFLIQNGAKLVGRPQDILDELPTILVSGREIPSKEKKDGIKELDEKSQGILSFIGGTSVSKETMAIQLGHHPKDLLNLLLTLELKGFIRLLPGNRVVRK